MPRWHRNVCFSWLDDFQDVQNVLVFLLWTQVVLGLVSSIDSSFPSANVAVSLFGIIALTLGYEVLGKTYITFLCCTILLDILWFGVRIHEEQEKLEPFFYVHKISVGCEAVSCLIRMLSLYLYLQLYQLGNEGQEPHYFDFGIGPYPDNPSYPSTSVVSHGPQNEDSTVTKMYDPQTYRRSVSQSDSDYFSLLLS